MMKQFATTLALVLVATSAFAAPGAKETVKKEAPKVEAPKASKELNDVSRQQVVTESVETIEAAAKTDKSCEGSCQIMAEILVKSEQGKKSLNIDDAAESRLQKLAALTARKVKSGMKLEQAEKEAAEELKMDKRAIEESCK